MSARHFAEQLRLKASTLHAQGRTVTQIAAEVGRSERAVYGWVRKLKEGGAAALKRQPGTGKSLGLTKAQWLRLGRDLERKPATARVKAAQWNPSAFAVLVTKVTGKPCNRFLARRMMPVLDYYYKKPEVDEALKKPKRAGTWLKHEASRIPLKPDPVPAQGQDSER